MLDSLHSLRLLIDTPVGQRAADLKYDNNYYYRIFAALCNRNLAAGDPIMESLVSFRLINPAHLNSERVTQSLTYLAIQAAVNMGEHVSRNMEPIFKRMLILVIKRDFPMALEDTKKLAHHIYKLLFQLWTVWPRTVARTIDNSTIVQIMVGRYHGWFNAMNQPHLLENNGIILDLPILVNPAPPAPILPPDDDAMLLDEFPDDAMEIDDPPPVPPADNINNLIFDEDDDEDEDFVFDEEDIEVEEFRPPAPGLTGLPIHIKKVFASYLIIRIWIYLLSYSTTHCAQLKVLKTKAMMVSFKWLTPWIKFQLNMSTLIS